VDVQRRSVHRTVASSGLYPYLDYELAPLDVHCLSGVQNLPVLFLTFYGAMLCVLIDIGVCMCFIHWTKSKVLLVLM
jgi:hypothetical protein